ncbi:MAG: HEAT repeat domain-containing protein, partial [Verrucomicrobia bacterium]|nr:HEAT repeat domain-containing protein [Verrucomicrobiota bacterium]
MAVPALVRVLNDEDDDLRYFATRALGNLAAEPGQAVPALVDRLADPNVEVRRIAARSLG